jgi:hypothetical protein
MRKFRSKADRTMAPEQCGLGHLGSDKPSLSESRLGSLEWGSADFPRADHGTPVVPISST